MLSVRGPSMEERAFDDGALEGREIVMTSGGLMLETPVFPCMEEMLEMMMMMMALEVGELEQ